MELIRQPNRWSCLGVSFAMALGIPYAKVTELVGHDGSEIIWPELPEPLRRRGFHIQEMIRVAWMRDYLVTPILAHFVVTPDTVHKLQVTQLDFAQKLLQNHSGVLTGQGIKNNHAIAWDHKTQRIFDPNGLVYAPENGHFTPETFWLISKSK